MLCVSAPCSDDSVLPFVDRQAQVRTGTCPYIAPLRSLRLSGPLDENLLVPSGPPSTCALPTTRGCSTLTSSLIAPSLGVPRPSPSSPLPKEEIHVHSLQPRYAHRTDSRLNLHSLSSLLFPLFLFSNSRTLPIAGSLCRVETFPKGSLASFDNSTRHRLGNPTKDS